MVRLVNDHDTRQLPTEVADDLPSANPYNAYNAFNAYTTYTAFNVYNAYTAYKAFQSYNAFNVCTAYTAFNASDIVDAFDAFGPWCNAVMYFNPHSSARGRWRQQPLMLHTAFNIYTAYNACNARLEADGANRRGTSSCHEPACSVGCTTT